ncbi:DUF6308 family protein [Actinotalea sp. K2]|uniref:DUF6308 family protein n=1 Tax=Actinotalea sp. K2 TaxID=2939438 RepID=UPI002016B8AE|nr:DUF6308 family protein [Actinotalea sp. K2]MCL3863013.1 DUF6308 family protein [Actinotalea sp. K2]
MSDPELWQQIPDGWPVADPALIANATNRSLDALSNDTDRTAISRLARYYDRTRNFVGATFVELFPNTPNDITAVDLHAVTLMSVEIGPGATRRLLGGNTHRPAILEALAGVEHKDLLVAGPADLLAMEKLYAAVKAALSDPSTKDPNAWVTASKLCARKRPDLFPVRDNLVCNYLGLIPTAKGAKGNYQIDYQVYRALIGDRQIIEAIDALREQLRAEHDVRADSGRLRVLDAALWTWAAGKGRKRER